MKTRNTLLPFLFFTLLSWPSTAQGDEEMSREEYIRTNYTKFEYRIPMRDGKKLFTAVYSPNDTSKTYPFLMVRTPYSVDPYGADRYRETLGPEEDYEKEGFIFVFQDVRGRFMSEGEYVNMRPHVENKKKDDVDESTDTHDTIEWLLKNVPNSNGRVGQWGVSYPGFYTSAGMINSHPALKAVSPQAPIADWFWDDMHHHGAFILPLAFNFFSIFGQPREELTTKWPEEFDHKTPDGYQFFLDLGPLKNVNESHFEGEIDFWNQLTEHPNYDEFWQSKNLLPHLRGVTAAVMVVGGWFDTEDLYGPLKTYKSVEEKNPGIHNTIVMGPWRHGGWHNSDGESLGKTDFGFETSKDFLKRIELPFFLHYLKDGDDPRIPEALMFETGANRWRSFNAWPPPGLSPRVLYFQDGGELDFEAPSEEGEAFDEYPSDPSKPVPYTMEITTGWAWQYMTEDQRFAAWRPDVLVYKSDVLEEDLTLAGPLTADLWVSTTGTDSDWIVKLVDVQPNEPPGEEDDEEEREGPGLGALQMLVRAEVLRGRFRDSYEHPKPFVPGELTHLEFELLDVFHTFKRGHRIMVQVQSTWFPFVDRNPQKYVPNIFEAEEEDFIKVTNRVYRSKEHPSGLRVGVLP